MAHLPGKFVWFEHVSNDIAAARAFYEKLFDWNTEVMAMQGTDPYVMIHNGDAGIGGYAKARPGAPTAVDVVPLGAGRRQLVQGGARRRREERGRADGLRRRGPHGDDRRPDRRRVLALARRAERPPEVETTPPGGWIWNELATQDEKTALAFYEKVFAFDHDAMAMPEGTYYVLKQGGKGRAGLYKAMDASMPTIVDRLCLRRRRRPDHRAGAAARCARRRAAERRSRRRPTRAVRRSAGRVDRDPEAEPDDGLSRARAVQAGSPASPRAARPRRSGASARALGAGGDPSRGERAELLLRSRRRLARAARLPAPADERVVREVLLDLRQRSAAVSRRDP